MQSHPGNWKDLGQEEKLERIRQEQLNEIMAGSDLAVTEVARGEVLYDPSYFMQERPSSGVNFNSLGLQRKMSAVVGKPMRGSEMSLQRPKSMNRPPGFTRDRTADLKMVYGQTGHLSAFEEQVPAGRAHQNEINAADEMHKPRRGLSGKPTGRLSGLETIYLTKIPKLRPTIN